MVLRDKDYSSDATEADADIKYCRHVDQTESTKW